MPNIDNPRPQEFEFGKETPFKKAVRSAARIHKADPGVVREQTGEHSFTNGNSTLQLRVTNIGGELEFGVKMQSGDTLTSVTYFPTKFGEIKSNDKGTKYHQADAMLTLLYGSADDITVDNATALRRKKEQTEAYHRIEKDWERQDEADENIVDDNQLRAVFRQIRDFGKIATLPSDKALDGLDHHSLLRLFMLTTEELTTRVTYTSHWEGSDQDEFTLITTTDRQARPLHVQVTKYTGRLGEADNRPIESWHFDHEKDTRHFSGELMLRSFRQEVSPGIIEIEAQANKSVWEAINDPAHSSNATATANDLRKVYLILDDPETIVHLVRNVNETAIAESETFDIFTFEPAPDTETYRRPSVEIDLTLFD